VAWVASLTPRSQFGAPGAVACVLQPNSVNQIGLLASPWATISWCTAAAWVSRHIVPSSGAVGARSAIPWYGWVARTSNEPRAPAS